MAKNSDLEKSLSDVLLQKQFFHQLKKKLVSEKSMVSELMQLLGLGKTSIYRRLSGESILSLAETMKIARQYNMLLDQFVYPDESRMIVDFPVMENPIRNAADFLSDIELDMVLASQLDQVSIDFISREIPLFHYFNFPELTAFKAYIWSRTIWRLPEFQDRQFSLNQIKGLLRHQKNILKYYNQMPGTEIWSTDSLAITLLQIEHYLFDDMFKYPEEALLLCQQLKQLFEHLFEMTTHGKKFPMGKKPKADSPDFSLYHNQLAHSNSFILVASPKVNMSFVTIDNLHTVKSTDAQFFYFMNNWKNNLIKQSIHISTKAARPKIKFFNKIEKQILAFEKKIKRKLE